MPWKPRPFLGGKVGGCGVCHGVLGFVNGCPKWRAFQSMLGLQKIISDSNFVNSDRRIAPSDTMKEGRD